MRKYILLAIATVFMFNVAVTAQDPATSPNKGEKKEFKQGERATAEKRAAKMAKELELTDAQKASVQALLEKQDVIFDKFRAETPKESPDFRTKFKELRQNQDAELKVIIGEEKFQKLQTIRAEQRANAQKKAE